MARGRFITFEGGEGSGKSTQLRMLADDLRDARAEVIETREPGGTAGAEIVRRLLLKGAVAPFGPEAEAAMFAAARSDHVRSVIVPALADGKHVLSDRFMDSSRAYQSGAAELVRTLERTAIEGAYPDLTLIFDIDPKVGVRRVAARDGALDRFESMSFEEQEMRRQAFLRIAKEEPERCVVIDADADIADVRRSVRFALRDRLGPLVGQANQEAVAGVLQ